MTSECDKLRDHWAAYLYDELPEALSVRMRKHLQECEACVQELDMLYKTREAVEWYRLSTPMESLPDGFPEEVMEAIRRGRGSRRPSARHRRTPVWISLAAVLLLAFLAYFALPDLLVDSSGTMEAEVSPVDNIGERVRPILEATATPTPHPTLSPEATPIPTLRDLPFEMIRPLGRGATVRPGD